LRVHEENNSPFLTVTSLDRVIEVSHWGNIAVEEHIDVKHTGAKLKGSFSRFDYQRQQDGIASVKSFKVNFISLVSFNLQLTLNHKHCHCSPVVFFLESQLGSDFLSQISICNLNPHSEIPQMLYSILICTHSQN